LSVGFDLERHRREKLRRSEARAESLDAYRCKLERLLGRALAVACAETDATPLALLDVLEDLDTAVQHDPGLSPGRLADLLGGPV
jgi:hypothetical protein